VIWTVLCALGALTVLLCAVVIGLLVWEILQGER